MPAEYYFAHLLTRDAAYRALLRSNLRALHTAAAQAVNGRIVPGAPDESALLAQEGRHWLRAEAYPRAHERCCALLNLLLATGRPAEWVQWAEEAKRIWQLARAADPALPAESAQLLRCRGDFARISGNYAEARALLTRGLALAQAAGEHVLAGNIELVLGRIASDQGDLDGAERYFEASLVSITAAGLRHRATGTMINLASIHYFRERFAKSEAILHEVLELARQHGDQRIESTALGNLGNLHAEAGKWAEAAACYQAQLELARQIGNKRSEAWALANLGSLACERGELAASRALLEQVLGRGQALGDLILEDLVVAQLVEVLLWQDELEQAAALLWPALDSSRERGDDRAVGRKLGLAGQLHCRRGDLAAGAAAFSEGRDLLRRAGDKLLLRNLLTAWRDALLAAGESSTAAELDSELAGLDSGGK